MVDAPLGGRPPDFSPSSPNSTRPRIATHAVGSPVYSGGHDRSSSSVKFSSHQSRIAASNLGSGGFGGCRQGPHASDLPCFLAFLTFVAAIVNRSPHTEHTTSTGASTVNAGGAPWRAGPRGAARATCPCACSNGHWTRSSGRSALGGCHTTRDTAATRATAGFELVSLDRGFHASSPVAITAAPYIIGFARRAEACSRASQTRRAWTVHSSSRASQTAVLGIVNPCRPSLAAFSTEPRLGASPAASPCRSRPPRTPSPRTPRACFSQRSSHDFAFARFGAPKKSRSSTCSNHALIFSNSIPDLFGLLVGEVLPEALELDLLDEVDLAVLDDLLVVLRRLLDEERQSFCSSSGGGFRSGSRW